MKKRLLSLLLILTMLMTSVVVMAEDFVKVEKVNIVDSTIEVSFSNGIFRTFEESKSKVKILSGQDEVKISFDIKDEGKGKEKSKTFIVLMDEILDGKEYTLVIGKDFKANNGNSLEEDYSLVLEGLKVTEIDKVEETVEESPELVEETVEEEVEEVKEEKEIKTPFTDIKENKAEKQIARLYKKGLVIGKTETEYKPNDEILFVEGISIISRYLKLEDMAEIEEFNTDAWYREDVLKAIKKGLISEKDIEKLNEKITMKDLSDILFNIKNELEFEVEDVEAGRTLVKEILSKNYDEDTKIEGKKELTRGDFATIFGNLIKK